MGVAKQAFKTLERCSKPHLLFEKSEAKTLLENFVFLMTNRNKNYFIKLLFLDTPFILINNDKIYDIFAFILYKYICCGMILIIICRNFLRHFHFKNSECIKMEE